MFPRFGQPANGVMASNRHQMLYKLRAGLSLASLDYRTSFEWAVSSLRTRYPAYKHQLKTAAPAFRLGQLQGCYVSLWL
jgi:hypothetical protein